MIDEDKIFPDKDNLTIEEIRVFLSIGKSAAYKLAHTVWGYLPLSDTKQSGIRMNRDVFVRWYVDGYVRPLTVETVMGERA